MKLVKCPRCDLNYITEAEKLCKVCIREMKGSRSDDELELCSVCNAAPALPGKDVCLGCLKEMNDTTGGRDQNDGQESASAASLSLDPVSDMDEIIPDNDDENEISLETVIEEENEDDDEDSEDDEI